MDTNDVKSIIDEQQLPTDCRQKIIQQLYISIMNNVKMSMDLHSLLFYAQQDRNKNKVLTNTQIIKVQKDLIDGYLLLEQLKSK
jgi:hypothetical protein